MCDYCDCRSIPEIALLSVEHERVLSLMAKLRRLDNAEPSSGDADERARLLHELRVEFEPHTRREEIGVFSVQVHLHQSVEATVKVWVVQQKPQ